jgi:hypothetical protein
MLREGEKKEDNKRRRWRQEGDKERGEDERVW